MWDYETDVVVIGYGGAGSAAAITPHDAGARVLILEKNKSGGGNTRISGGSIRTYADRAKAIEYMHALCEGATDFETIRAFVDESAGNADWIAGLEGKSVASYNALCADGADTAFIPVEETSAKRSRSVELLARTPPWSCHCRGNELAST